MIFISDTHGTWTYYTGLTTHLNGRWVYAWSARRTTSVISSHVNNNHIIIAFNTALSSSHKMTIQVATELLHSGLYRDWPWRNLLLSLFRLIVRLLQIFVIILAGTRITRRQDIIIYHCLATLDEEYHHMPREHGDIIEQSKGFDQTAREFIVCFIKACAGPS